MVCISENTIIIDNTRATLEDKIELENALEKLLSDGSQVIYLDLGKPRYLPSELMGLLMWKKKLLMEENKNLRISHLNSNLKDIFENAFLTDFFEIDVMTAIV